MQTYMYVVTKDIEGHHDTDGDDDDNGAAPLKSNVIQRLVQFRNASGLSALVPLPIHAPP